MRTQLPRRPNSKIQKADVLSLRVLGPVSDSRLQLQAAKPPGGAQTALDGDPAGTEQVGQNSGPDLHDPEVVPGLL